MKAFFPIVGEKEYKDSTLRTEQRQCVFTKLHVESVFISFVSFSFNSHHVSIDIHHWAIPHCGQTQQFNIQHSKVNIALRASACKKLFVSFALLPPFGLWAFGESRVQNLVFLMWAPRREQYPCDPWDPCALKKQSKIRMQIIFVSFALFVFKIISCSSPPWAPRREQDPCDPCDPCA